MTTFALLASPEAQTLTPLTPKRNRHSVENDQLSALVKRINRHYLRNECNRKVVVRNGELIVTRLFTDAFGDAGEVRMIIGPATVKEASYWLASVLFS